MKELIFLKPVFHQMLWGGNRMETEFGYKIPGDNTGECWAVSAHEQGDCEVNGGTYSGKKLSQLWKEHKELFGYMPGKEFPLLVKIIDAREDLSIQVHPDDKYAFEHENGALGKTECWYILDCNEDSDIIIGHNAADRAELKNLISAGKWNELITPRHIKKGDFFQIEPGTVHAIRKGTLLLETQQNSAITYRLYDYDRLQDGKKRELHIEKSIDVIKCPQVYKQPEQKLRQHNNASVTELVDCRYYKVFMVTLRGSTVFEPVEPFMIINVIKNEGKVDGRTVRKGEHFIVPAGYGSIEAEGDAVVIVSIPKYDEMRGNNL